MGLFREIFYNSQGYEFEHLTDYKGKAIVAAHLGFCMDYYSTEEPDYNDLDCKGNPILKPRKGKPFVDIAVDICFPHLQMPIRFTERHWRR